MRLKLTILLVLALFYILVPTTMVLAASAPDTLADKLSGRILLQVESYGRAWYVYPKDKKRYYLRNGQEAYALMRTLGLGISDADLAKIPIRGEQNRGDAMLVNRLRGMILLQVEQNGEAWYVSPVDGKRYYLRDGQAAYDIMRSLALGISNDNLRLIPINTQQITPTFTFNAVAYAGLHDTAITRQQYAHNILPLASLTKLMTALVIMDHAIDFDSYVTISQEQIDYPKMYVGNDATSEVNLQVGDTVRLSDLWVSMLLASSNQAAVILADATGLSRTEFVSAMNAKAKELGLEKTVFYDVAGLDAHNAATPYEAAIMGRAALSNNQIAQASILDKHHFIAQTATTTRQVNAVNRNFSLLAFLPDGAKTGFLVEAQRNAIVKKGDTVVAIMHARSMNERNEILKLFFPQE